jgi:hypothetical protein
MPQTQPSASGTTSVPVAILLPNSAEWHSSSATQLPDWRGVQARDLAGLITGYTRRGDVVLTLDAHSTVPRAARHLGRHVAVLTPDHHLDHTHTAAHVRRRIRRTGAALILVSLPNAQTTQLHGIAEAIRRWRELLRPGGHLLAAVTGQPTDGAPASRRSQVIAAARSVGLVWRQEFLVLLAPLPEYEPRAMPDTAALTVPALVNGRHLPAHIKLLAFATQTGNVDA